MTLYYKVTWFSKDDNDFNTFHKVFNDLKDARVFRDSKIEEHFESVIRKITEEFIR